MDLENIKTFHNSKMNLIYRIKFKVTTLFSKRSHKLNMYSLISMNGVVVETVFSVTGILSLLSKYDNIQWILSNDQYFDIKTFIAAQDLKKIIVLGPSNARYIDSKLYDSAIRIDSKVLPYVNYNLLNSETRKYVREVDYEYYILHEDKLSPEDQMIIWKSERQDRERIIKFPCIELQMYIANTSPILLMNYNTASCTQQYVFLTYPIELARHFIRNPIEELQQLIDNYDNFIFSKPIIRHDGGGIGGICNFLKFLGYNVEAILRDVIKLCDGSYIKNLDETLHKAHADNPSGL